MRLAIIAVALAAALPALAHDHWLNTMQDPKSGDWCCGENDCQEEHDNIREVRRGYLVISTGEVIPADRVIWKSPDGKWWRCRYPH